MSSRHRESPQSTSSAALPQLYPLGSLVEDVLGQEHELWERNEAILQSLRVPPSEGEDGEDSPDGVSMATGMADSVNGNGLQLIKYGQLTGTIHKYFRKLEKRHACLHLTARRARHDTLRHVETSAGGTDPSLNPNLLSATSALAEEMVNGQQQVDLRDDERLVYRCAVMCAQFPMLSAPDPPDGQSPSPPLPPLPAKFDLGTLGSLQENDLARTAPAETSTALMEKKLHNGALSNGIHKQDQSSKAGPQTEPSAEIQEVPVPTGSGRGHEVGSVDEVDSKRPNASEPIPIKSTKTKSKSRSLKRGSLITKLSGVDSDSEEELTIINSGRPPLVNGTGTEREHPFSPMVNREMLCNLVRRAFSQTEEQQLMFEQALRQEYSRRSKGEILAKELAGQLQVLENNAHPFYKPKFFVTRNGYDLWLQAEKQRVKSLIDKFWHFSLPRPQLWRHYNPTDYHKAYSTLLLKVISAESRTSRREPVYSGRTPSSPLSPTAQRLLTEFGLRYGVGELYRRIVYLDYLAKHFDYEIWYIRHCTEELRAIRTLLPRNRNKITAVRREMEMLRSTVHLLHGQTDNSLTRIDRLFMDSDPRDGVASLIELLTHVLDAEQSLFGKKVGPVDHWLKRYLKSGFVLRYERRKEIAADETVQSRTVAQPFMLTPTLVNSLLLDTRDEVLVYRDKYQEVFRQYFDIVPFSKLEFYRLLCADACSLCAGLLHRPETRQKMSLEMLGLMYRLNEKDLEWEAIISPGLQLWRRHFSDLALVWMEVLGRQVYKWVVESVAKDQWTLLTFSAHPPSSRQTPPLTTSHRHSPMVTRTIRTSPFPSPNPHGQERRFTPTPLSKSSGAFSPYSSYMGQLLKRTDQSPRNSPSEEGSGAVTDASSSTTTISVDSTNGLLIGGGIPSIGRALSSQPNTDSLLNFGQEESRGSHDEETVANQIEVAVSVYSGYESERDELHLCQISPSPADKALPTDKSDHTPLSEDSLPTQSQLDPSVEISTSNPPESGSLPVEGAHKDKQTPAEEKSPPRSASEDPIDVVSKVVSNREYIDSKTGPPDLTVVRGQRSSSGHTHSGKSSLQESSDFHASLSIDVTDPPPVVKFGNLLDNCKSDSSVARPRVVRPSGQRVERHMASTEESHVPPASVGTVPELANWWKAHPRQDSVAIGDQSTAGSTLSAHSSTSPEVNQKPNYRSSMDYPTDESQRDTPTVYRPVSRGSFQSFFFPVSNSPLDIVTMLSRLASFTGTILNVLTPRITRSSLRLNGNPSHEYAPEVAQAREQAKLLWTSAENNKTEFLKKVHRIMLNSLKLYADNLLCMDLCCFSGGEASSLVGDQKLQHLKRRKTSNEIWGCRHMVEARHGLHPNGMPCQKKATSTQFESITRDMCIRINNIHTLITIFPSLENYLYSSMRTSTQQPITAHGYVSSDPGEISPRHAHAQTYKPNPHSTRPPSDGATLLGVPNDQKDLPSIPSSISPSLGPMEPDGDTGRRELPDVGFRSKESQQVLEYLQTTQKYQLKLLCLRMNKFFKPALSLLLGLKLDSSYPIDKRLLPLLTFLERHRLALQKYLYPDCFTATMEYMWGYILQDIESEAIQLRAKKRPVTDTAQMLLQTLSILIECMHHKGEGLPLDTLTGPSEYLLGLLDVMTRSTDQLITMFTRLSAPQFSRDHFDLSRSPVPIDTRVLQCLRNQLHRYKKCFSGKEFVDKVLEVGQLYDLRPDSSSQSSTPTQIGGRAGIDPSGQPVEYTVRYATQLAQFLLNESILIELPSTNSLTRGLADRFTPVPSDDDASLAASFEPDVSDGLSSESQSSVSYSRRHLEQRSHHSSYQSVRSSRKNGPEFSNTRFVFYKFADSEDVDANSLYQSQILAASSTSQTSRNIQGSNLGLSVSRSSAGTKVSLKDEYREFNNARQGTLFLVYDLLVQRSRKEKRAKQFLQLPRALEVLEQKRMRAVTCDLIFKM